jgi:hypothetical protein
VWICGYPLRQCRSQLRRDGGKLVELVVMSGIVGRDVRQVDDGRAQLRKLGNAGVVAYSRDAASDGSGEPQRVLSRELGFGRTKVRRLGSSSRRGRCLPILERFPSEDAERVAGNKMALNVERVMDDCVDG